MGGGSGVVSLRKIRERHVVVVNHGVGCALTGGTPRRRGDAVLILLRADSVGAVVGVGDLLAFGVSGLDDASNLIETTALCLLCVIVRTARRF